MNLVGLISAVMGNGGRGGERSGEGGEEGDPLVEHACRVVIPGVHSSILRVGYLLGVFLCAF